jgi:repressor LexA
MLRALEKKGLMQSDGTAHGWRASETHALHDGGTTANVRRVVVRGTIAAGAPFEAIDSSAAPGGDDDYVVLPAEQVDSETFALRVRGDSMIDDHILDGDVIVVRRQSRVEDGEIAVALLDDGTATLKRIYREPGKKRIRLQPANSRLGPLFVSKVEVQGRVVGLVRSFRRS